MIGISSTTSASNSGKRSIGLDGNTSISFGSTQKRPKISESELTAPRAIQGEVTANWSVDRTLYGTRVGKHSKDGKIRLLGSVSTASDINIREHDVVVHQKGSKYCFSAFNGVDTTKFHTQEEFEDSFAIVGRAKAGFDFEDNVSGTKIAVQVRGACSLMNNSGGALVPGDIVALRIPNIKGTGNYVDAKGRILAQLVKVDKLPATGQLIRAVYRLYDATKMGKSIELLSVENTSSASTFRKSMSTEETLGVAATQTVLMDGLSLVHTLLEYGMISINIPAGALVNVGVNTSVKNVCDTSNPTPYKNITIAPNTGALTTTPMTNGERAERAEKFLYLAVMLGVWVPANNSGIKATKQPELIRNTVGKSYAGHITGSPGLALSRLFHGSDNVTAPIADPVLVHAWKEIDSRQKNSHTHLHSEMDATNNLGQSKIVGKVLSYSKACTDVDILM